MHSMLLIGGLLSSVVIVSAFAQSSPPAPSAPPAQTPPMAAPAPASKPADTVAVRPAAQSGQWRASKLVGLNVYNEQNEKLGDISEILLDKSGKVEGVIIGVGGFLGMGEHNVGLAWNQVKFVNEAPRAAARDGGTTTTTGTGTGTATGTGTTARTANTGQRDYPDHAVVNMTKDQLKAMQAFKYASDNR
jgi:sporulation protein YlmC with PRC-barrel domain